ncbi:uncharacterized protein A4U43_C01F30270 [Asparagus officinalis]|uniref:Phosphoinositide phosphatase SAC9 n=1 Tax=Asparagus officinalis TaxID=4686 RepID=A0A5P1FTA1_ASPOF|nr:uncharacterized protein A4U43_C01F30270 [Asparagus officinalis]
MSFDQFKSSTMLGPINQLADLFLLAGDIHATLYTGSKAMHSQILNIFSDDGGGKFSKFSAAQNVKITLQRRYQNVLVDSSRQKQLEMFLGIRLFKHLPSVPVQPLKVLSRPSGCFLKPIPSMVSVADDGSSLLSFKKKELVWVCPPAADVVELFIYLGEPCHVSGLLFTVSHGVEDSSYPATVDVRTGCNLDALKLVLEIEVLGVSLPWMGIFTKNSIGEHFIEDLRETLEKNNSVLHGSEKNKRENSFLRHSCPSFGSEKISSKGSFVESVQPSAVSHGIDLLTGDLLFSHSTSRSDSSEGAVQSSESIIDFFDRPGADSQFQRDSDLPAQSHDNNGSNHSMVQHYLHIFKSLSSSNKGAEFDFLQAMKLEIERLRLNLSAAERDKALLSISVDPANVDPHRLLDEMDMVKLCSYADSLALLGQAAFEDVINASTGLDAGENSVIDFWNINELGETCLGKMCEVRSEQLGTSSFNISSSDNSSMFLECSQCGRRACRICCAGKGALLLLNGNNKEMKIYNGISSQGGSNHERSYSSYSNTENEVVCKSCCNTVVLYALYVDYIRVLSSLRRRARGDSAAQKAVSQVVGHDLLRSSDSWQHQEITNRQLNMLLDGEESLAELPHASLLHSVETAPQSEPVLSLLAPLGVGKRKSYWRAPSSSPTVEFSIVLESLSDVSGVALIVSSCGYSQSDCPTVQVWASNNIHRDEGSCMGKWDVQSLASSSPELYGPENSYSDSDIPRHVKFLFRNPVRCRIIWITLTLPQHGSASFNIVEECDLLSLDENPFAKSNRAYSGGTVKSEAYIHAKRILVFGSSAKKEIGNSVQNPELMKMRSLLDRSSQLGRFRIPVEAERLADNDFVSEQYIAPTAPAIAGFRLDAFGAIKPRITHSPSPLDVDIWQSSLTCLEDRHISPAVLYIQVSAVQEPRNCVIVGEYRLPEVRAGTALYFDFPSPIQARQLIFRLLGDVAAFADDISEQDDTNFKANPLASGLSLSNKTKLYYYADPYELGKLASLSAV